jgi:hypothetical protein
MYLASKTIILIIQVAKSCSVELRCKKARAAPVVEKTI